MRRMRVGGVSGRRRSLLLVQNPKEVSMNKSDLEASQRRFLIITLRQQELQIFIICKKKFEAWLASSQIDLLLIKIVTKVILNHSGKNILGTSFKMVLKYEMMRLCNCGW